MAPKRAPLLRFVRPGGGGGLGAGGGLEPEKGDSPEQPRRAVDGGVAIGYYSLIVSWIRSGR